MTSAFSAKVLNVGTQMQGEEETAKVKSPKDKLFKPKDSSDQNSVDKTHKIPPTPQKKKDWSDTEGRPQDSLYTRASQTL